MLMIMKSNSKKCSTMRKFITTMLIAAAAFTACVQNDEVVVPNNNDKITFTATVTAPESRTVLVQDDADTYHAEWAEGDVVNIYEAMACEVSDERPQGRTKTASIEPTITVAGKTTTITESFSARESTKFWYVLGSAGMSMNGTTTTIAFTLPAQQAPTAMNALDSAADVIVSQIVELDAQPTEPVTFAATRISSIAKVSVKVPTALAADDAVKSVTFACDKVIAGKYSLKWDSVYAGTPLESYVNNASDKSITVTLPTAQNADFSYYMGLWETTLAKDSKVTVTLLTNNDKKFVKEITLTKDLVFTTGDMTTLTVNMSAVAEYVEQTYEPIEGTVNVAGIYWALGNLEYEVDGTTDEGFAAGWRIAPTQYHHFNMTASAGSDVTLSDYTKAAHFNFGGIGDAMSNKYNSALHIAAPIGDADPFDFSGKMFTDATCTTPTTSWADAQYGDIAYWASKGQYRMPTAAEFEELHTKACYTEATYSDGTNTIYGSYFYNPGAGENPGKVEGTKTIKDTDLSVGLFLPWSGRAYNNAEYNVYKVHSQGFYRTSTVYDASTAEKGYGLIYRVSTFEIITNTGGRDVTDSDNKTANTFNFGATSRYAIRPIYIAE